MTPVPPNSWRNPPSIVARGNPKDGEILLLKVSRDITDVLRPGVLKTPLFMVWVHLLGLKPPMRQAGSIDLHDLVPSYSTLQNDATACFRGIKRPCGDDDNGATVCIFVMRPYVSVRYVPSMASLVDMYEVPNDMCLTVHAVMRPPSGRGGVNGIITRLEYVRCDIQSGLPIDHESRYEERLW